MADSYDAVRQQRCSMADNVDRCRPLRGIVRERRRSRSMLGAVIKRNIRKTD